MEARLLELWNEKDIKSIVELYPSIIAGMQPTQYLMNYIYDLYYPYVSSTLDMLNLFSLLCEAELLSNSVGRPRNEYRYDRNVYQYCAHTFIECASRISNITTRTDGIVFYVLIHALIAELIGKNNPSCSDIALSELPALMRIDRCLDFAMKHFEQASCGESIFAMRTLIYLNDWMEKCKTTISDRVSKYPLWKALSEYHPLDIKSTKPAE